MHKYTHEYKHKYTHKCSTNAYANAAQIHTQIWHKYTHKCQKCESNVTSANMHFTHPRCTEAEFKQREEGIVRNRCQKKWANENLDKYKIRELQGLNNSWIKGACSSKLTKIKISAILC